MWCQILYVKTQDVGKLYIDSVDRVCGYPLLINSCNELEADSQNCPDFFTQVKKRLLITDTTPPGRDVPASSAALHLWQFLYLGGNLLSSKTGIFMRQPNFKVITSTALIELATSVLQPHCFFKKMVLF
jgi:hypothetical protein